MAKKLRIEDLKKLRDEVRQKALLREGKGRGKITVHMGTCGIASGAREIMDALLRALEEQKIDDVLVATSGCGGLCSREPMATVEIRDQAPVKYVDLTPEKIRRVLNDHVLGGKIVTEYALAMGSERSG